MVLLQRRSYAASFAAPRRCRNKTCFRAFLLEPRGDSIATKKWQRLCGTQSQLIFLFAARTVPASKQRAERRVCGARGRLFGESSIRQARERGMRRG
jgi:hypothetical protein